MDFPEFQAGRVKPERDFPPLWKMADARHDTNHTGKKGVQEGIPGEEGKGKFFEQMN